MEHIIHTSVRPLVEYVFRSGSITSGFQSTSTMTEGTKAHQYIQSQYKDTDKKEVLFQQSIPFRDLVFEIEGRCDGLLFHDDQVVIEEIKSTQKDIHEISKEDKPVHWAQAKVYAYIYAFQHKLTEIDIQLTYIQVETYEQLHFKETYSFNELEAFLNDVLEGFYPYAILLHNHQKNRNKSAQALTFPFPTFRDGQRYFAGAVYKSIKEQSDLFANAPTGTGKTISTTFPAIKAMGEGHLTQFYYLTAKTVTRQIAEEALTLMIQKGLEVKAVTITAKDKICFKEDGCTNEHCPFTEGYYDRINDTIIDVLTNESLLNQPVIESYAKKHMVCPFELSLDLAYSADAVICDYNYIFDPRVSLKRLGNDQKKHTALLIDEAHNLVDRARTMFSAELFKSSFTKIITMYNHHNNDLVETASALKEAFSTFEKQAENKQEVFSSAPSSLLTLLSPFIKAAEEELLDPKIEGEESEHLLETYFTANSFIKIGQLYNESYVTYLEQWRQEVVVKMFCVNPSLLLKKAGKDFQSKTYFSATLTPLDYYKDMLGAKEEDYQLAIPSPFASEHTQTFIKPISTRYRDRDQSINQIAKTIRNFTMEETGNYIVFLPSYEYMYRIYDAFQDLYPEVETILQHQDMNEKNRAAYLDNFVADPTQTLIGFAVLGGIFSEGIDLKGNRLSGVFIIGVGFPQIGLERNIIKDYFANINKNGFDYAYRYPGMNKVLQAGGRLIRTESDKGFIVLIDDRFLQASYKTLLPPEWRDYTVL
ncbi:ATP-dependent helicase [Pontibacillus yanchengensis Y32]|uniref:ATP-dependent helicase n=1 Tax=Pontibacillus yanchengensis Y32 TaxID=1385514 RepID=A0A0A2TWI3_9BACI|nr:helicase C-terminal domain-containing protein [Pontibacillus yanchengensis]KGP73655.1 ATP-dependent helicase [Pontibacillus yanchengensis Y32]